MGLFPDQGVARFKTPAMGTRKRRVEFRGSMVVITVEKIWRNQEQAQIKIFRFKRASFPDDRGKGMVVGEERANFIARIGVVGYPG